MVDMRVLPVAYVRTASSETGFATRALCSLASQHGCSLLCLYSGGTFARAGARGAWGRATEHDTVGS